MYPNGIHVMLSFHVVQKKQASMLCYKVLVQLLLCFLLLHISLHSIIASPCSQHRLTRFAQLQA